MTGCVWCKGRALLDHDCRNFAHLEPENVEEPLDRRCDTCGGCGFVGDRPPVDDLRCPDCDGTGLHPPDRVAPSETMEP